MEVRVVAGMTYLLLVDHPDFQQSLEPELRSDFEL